MGGFSVEDIIKMGATGTMCLTFLLFAWKVAPAMVQHLREQTQAFKDVNDNLLRECADSRKSHENIVGELLEQARKSLEDCRVQNLQELSKQRHAFIRMFPPVHGFDPERLSRLMDESKDV